MDGEDSWLGRRLHVLRGRALPPASVPGVALAAEPVLWSLLALAAVARVPSYQHYSMEFRAVVPVMASMLVALLFEALSVRSVTAVLGLNWHRYVLVIHFQQLVIDAWESHGASAEDELREAH